MVNVSAFGFDIHMILICNTTHPYPLLTFFITNSYLCRAKIDNPFVEIENIGEDSNNTPQLCLLLR